MDILPPSSSKTQFASNAAQLANLFNRVHQLTTKIVQAVEIVVQEWAKAERQHRRGQLRKAYKVRRSWKKSDIAPLASLDVNETAQRKIENLTGTGRPVVQSYESLGERLLRKITAAHVLFNEIGTPEERRRAFWEWPWHEPYIEALYRGEHARAKSQGCRGASRFAEAEVADALRVSASKVHQICGRVRSNSGEDYGLPPATIAEFDAWMNTGVRKHLREVFLSF